MLLRSDIKIGRGASGGLSPLAHQRTVEEHRVYPLHPAGAWSAAVTGVTPPYPGICNFKLWQAPETGILAHVSVTGWLADQLLPIAAICCCSQSTVPPSHSSTSPLQHPAMLGQPRGFFFLISYHQLPCRSFAVANHLAPSSYTSEPYSQSLHVLAIW